MTIDWDDPEARFHLIEQVGVKEYNRLLNEHFWSTVIKTVNGYAICPAITRFGRVFWVEGTLRGFSDLKQAEDFAAQQPKGPTP